MDKEPLEEQNDDLPYSIQVDPSCMMTVFRSLVLFDELYLHMQAMNLAVIDTFLLDVEQAVLREYIDKERIPVDSCIFASALSQMWIFAVYELLRTWRQRVRELIDVATTKEIPKETPSPHDALNVNKQIRKKAIQRALKHPDYAAILHKHFDAVEPVFRASERIRVTLAKHEVSKSKGLFPHAPGYARINMLCGAMDFEVIHKDGSFEYINRRDLAEAIREIDIDSLPKPK